MLFVAFWISFTKSTLNVLSALKKSALIITMDNKGLGYLL